MFQIHLILEDTNNTHCEYMNTEAEFGLGVQLTIIFVFDYSMDSFMDWHWQCSMCHYNLSCQELVQTTHVVSI